MTVMQDTLARAGLAPYAGRTVRIRLHPNPAYVEADDTTVIAELDETTDADGAWSADLTPTSDVTPEGSWYTWQVWERGRPVGSPIAFTVPDSGPAWVGDHLTDPPAGLEIQHSHTAAGTSFDDTGLELATGADVQAAIANLEAGGNAAYRATTDPIPLPLGAFVLTDATRDSYVPAGGGVSNRGAVFFPAAGNSWAHIEIFLPTADCHLDIEWTVAADESGDVQWRSYAGQVGDGGTYANLTERSNATITAPAQHVKKVSRLLDGFTLGVGRHSLTLRRNAGAGGDTLAANAVVTAVYLIPVVPS